MGFDEHRTQTFQAVDLRNKSRDRIFREIDGELIIATSSGAGCSDEQWAAILGEAFGVVCTPVMSGPPSDLREALVELAAEVVAWLEDIDSRPRRKEHVEPPLVNILFCMNCHTVHATDEKCAMANDEVLKKAYGAPAPPPPATPGTVEKGLGPRKGQRVIICGVCRIGAHLSCYHIGCDCTHIICDPCGGGWHKNCSLNNAEGYPCICKHEEQPASCCGALPSEHGCRGVCP